MKAKLIIVEGLPGSGKSTTAQFISHQLSKNNLQANWFYEVGLSHPLDFTYVACLNKEEYLELISKYPNYSDILKKDVEILDNFYLFNYVYLERNYDFSNELIEYLTKFEITEQIENYMSLKLKKWSLFNQKMKDLDNVSVVESSLFQATIVECLLKDLPVTTIENHIQSLIKNTHDLNPTLIYYYQQNVRLAITEMFQYRGKDFTHYAIQLVENSSYGKRKNTKGIELAIDFFTECQLIANKLFESLDINKLKIDNTTKDYLHYQKQILSFLQFNFIEDNVIDKEKLKHYEGIYRQNEIDREFTLKLEHNTLFIYFNDTYKERLIPYKEDSFHIAASTLDINFHESEKSFMISGNDTAASYGKVGLVFTQK